MKHQTSSLQLCGQPIVLTLTQSTTRFGGSCRIVCTAARFVMSTSWSRAWSKSRNISTRTRWSSMSGQAVASTSSSLRSSTRWTFRTDFRCAEVLPIARTHTWQSITPVPIVDTGHLSFWVTLLNLLYSCCRCGPILLKFGDLFSI